MWASMMNRHRGKNEKRYKPEDLIKLSFDKKADENQVVVPAEVMIKRMGRKFKKNGN
jgi:hypothetical protein